MHHLSARGRLVGLLAIVFTLLLAAAACGGDDGDDPESFDRPDAAGDTNAGDTGSADIEGACDLLGTEDVAALLGQTVEDGEQEDIGEGTTQCTWATEESSQVVDSPITLTVGLGPLTDEVSAQIDDALDEPANRALDLGDRSVLVCGLGADGTSCDSYDSVAVAVDDDYLEIDLGNWGYPDDFSEEDGVQITEDAARQAIDGLG